MDARTWQQARALFDELVDHPAHEWHSRLESLCPHDPALRTEVLAMLRADLAAGDQTRVCALAPDLIEDIAQSTEKAQVDRWIGRRLGAWRIVRAIGRGGMGTVYLAEREDGGFGQMAAIKMLRGENEPAAISRFLSERQILARLEHPHIARLFDGGSSEESGPWFALEYIDGTPIDQWADARQLDLQGRLRLFLDICDAVAYAHDRLVVHRDLKPSNILVDGGGRVTLLDFGIAKLLEADTGTDLTRTAARTFTPEYAAPEQIRGEPITTATDVYALGVVLFELLVGRRPYRVSHVSTAAYERAVVDQDVVRPSVAVSRATSAGDDAPDALAARRRTTATALKTRLRGDLDAIVLRALRKEPSHRYSSVRELARDIQASLDHRPVLARRGGRRYVAARFVRRNLIAVAMAMVATLALVGGLVAALSQARVAGEQRDAAERALAFMAGLFENADPGTGEKADLTVRDLLDRGVHDIRFALPENTDGRAGLLVAMASAYLGLELVEPAAPLIAEALRISRHNDDPVGTAKAAVQACRRFNYTADYGDCERLATEAEAVLDRRDPLQAALLAELVSARLVGLTAEDRHEELIQAARETLLILHDVPAHLEIRATLTGQMSRSLRDAGRDHEAEAVMRDLISILERYPSVKPSLVAHARDNLASALTDAGRDQEALQLSRQALEAFEALYGKDNPINATKMNNLAVSLYAAGEIEEAIALLKRVVDINRARFGGQRTASLAANLGNLGAFTLDAGRPEEALVHLDEAVMGYESSGTRASELGGFLWWRASARASLGRYADALSDLDHAAAVLEPLHPPEHPRRLRVQAMKVLVQMIDGGPAALNAVACAQVERVTRAYAAAQSPKPEDVALAGFAGSLCSDRPSAGGVPGDAKVPADVAMPEALNGFRLAIARKARERLAQ